jgi:hypothetical protein
MTADYHQLIRLGTFREHHPEIGVGEGEFGVWYATLPLNDRRYDEASGYLHDHDLGLLLDRLEEMFAGGGARSGP